MASTSMSSAEAFEIFDISCTISLDELKARFRDLARQNHPDKVDVSRKAAATMRMAQINNAYEILLNKVYEGRLPVPSPDFKPMSKFSVRTDPSTSQNASKEDHRPGSPRSRPEARPPGWNRSSARQEKDFQPGEPQDGYERARLLKSLEDVQTEIVSAYIDIKGIRDTRRDGLALSAIEIKPCVQLLDRFLEVLRHERANVETALEEWQKNSHNEEGFEKMYNDEKGRPTVFHASAAWMNDVMLKKQRALVSWVRRINRMWRVVKAKREDMTEWWNWLAKLREHYEGLLEGWEWEEELLTTNYDFD